MSRSVCGASDCGRMAHYQIERGGKQFEAQLVIQPAERPSSIENYLSVVGVLVSFHRALYFCAPVERDARRAFLYFLPGVVRPLLLPVHRKLTRIRLGNLLGCDRGQAVAAGVAVAFCAGISGAAPGFARGTARFLAPSTACPEFCCWCEFWSDFANWVSCRRSKREILSTGSTWRAWGFTSCSRRLFLWSAIAARRPESCGSS